MSEESVDPITLFEDACGEILSFDQCLPLLY